MSSEPGLVSGLDDTVDANKMTPRLLVTKSSAPSGQGPHKIRTAVESHSTSPTVPFHLIGVYRVPQADCKTGSFLSPPPEGGGLDLVTNRQVLFHQVFIPVKSG